MYMNIRTYLLDECDGGQCVTGASGQHKVLYEGVQVGYLVVAWPQYAR